MEELGCFSRIEAGVSSRRHSSTLICKLLLIKVIDHLHRFYDNFYGKFYVLKIESKIYQDFFMVMIKP